MRTRFIHWLACMLSVLPLAASAAELGITPVAMHLSSAVTRTTVNVVNYGKEAVTMQADAIAWTRVDGIDKDAATSDLVVNPAIFTVEPGQTQIVRVGLRNASQRDVESTYRLVLREVPTAPSDAAAEAATSVRVLVAMRVPVYVAPKDVVHKQHWQAVSDGRGKVQASIRNVGNVHYKVGKVNLKATAAADSAPVASSNIGAVVFPGEIRNIDLTLAQGSSGKDMVLEVFTDKGVQYVPLVLTQK